MQIILSKEEIEIIHDALITEEQEAIMEIDNDKRRGRDTTYMKKYRRDIAVLRKRFEPYIRRENDT